MAEVILLHNSI